MRLEALRKHKTSIGARLSALVALAVLSAVLVSSAASAWRETDRRFRSTRDELTGIANALASAVARPLANGARNDVAQSLVAIRQIPGIRYAQVVTSEGRLVAQIGQSVILESAGEHVKPNSEISLFAALVLRNYVLETPIVSGGERIGWLRVIADISHLRGAMADSVLSALMAGLIATGLALVIAGRLQRSITTPIQSLTEAMIETGRRQDYTRSVPRTSDDETGLMVDAFNAMMGEIRVRDQRLADHRDRLEVEVEERTSDLKAATLAAESANAAKSDFLATMSHEIRTPLNGMLVMAELLATGDLPGKLQRHADVIVSSGQSLIAIINDILDLSKIEAGRLELEEVPVSPRTVMEQVANLFSARAASKGLDLVCYAAPDVPSAVLADPVRLNQVLANLVNNALKFTETGHVGLRIDAETMPGDDTAGQRVRLRFSVEDTGIGIAADKIDTIFEPFSQADQSTTRKFGGTGIGLTISRKLVAAMGDTLAVDSEIGKGSTFYFSIEVGVVEPAGMAEIPNANGRPVLIAIDQGAASRGLAAIVADLGFRPVIDGEDTLATEATTPLAAVFAEPSRLAASWIGASPDTCKVVVAAVGDLDASRLVDEGVTARSILRPILPSDVRSILEDVAAGRATMDVAKSAKKPAAPSKEFKGLNVLAADDSPVNREVLSEALARLGIKVTLVEDGEKAVELARERRFDLVFMDCSMPGMDGYAATRMIRSEEEARGVGRVPIVALTAHVAGNDADAWRKAGMDGYMTKPFTLKAMTACFERWAEPSGTVDDTSDHGPSNGDDTGENALMTLNTMVLDDIRAMQSPGDDLVGRIAGLYHTHAPVALERIAEAAASAGSNGEPLAEAAHAMKSLCRNVGAERLSALLEVIESGARRDNRPCSSDQIAALRTELGQVMAELGALTVQPAVAPAPPSPRARQLRA